MADAGAVWSNAFANATTDGMETAAATRLQPFLRQGVLCAPSGPS